MNLEFEFTSKVFYLYKGEKAANINNEREEQNFERHAFSFFTD